MLRARPASFPRRDRADSVGGVTDATRTAPGDYSLDAALDEEAGSMDRLLDTVHGLTDADVRAPSRLPGWSRGHVLTHIARNADGLRNLLTWAATGVETPMYPSKASRDADIEAGAGRSAADLEADVESSGERLLAAFADFPPEGLERPVRTGSGAVIYGWEIPVVRIREIEIHHVDLDVGYTPAHWSPEFVVRTLDQLTDLFRNQRDVPVHTLRGTGTGREWQVGTAGPTLTGPESALLAWLTGRSAGDGLTSDADGSIPAAPRWI